MKTLKLTLLTISAVFFIFFGVSGTTNILASTNSVTIVSKIKPGPKYIWVAGHYKHNKFGKLVWVPGHWKKI
jgi:hypothetical protein